MATEIIEAKCTVKFFSWTSHAKSRLYSCTHESINIGGVHVRWNSREGIVDRDDVTLAPCFLGSCGKAQIIFYGTDSPVAKTPVESESMSPDELHYSRSGLSLPLRLLRLVRAEYVTQSSRRASNGVGLVADQAAQTMAECGAASWIQQEVDGKIRIVQQL